MAQRTKLAAVLNGLVRNVDLTADELVVDSLLIGGLAGTQLTKTVLDNLIANSHAAQSDNQNIIAGSGLSGGGSGASVTLDVNVDDSTIEIATDTLQVKDAGITEAKLNSGIDAQTFDATYTPTYYTPAQVGTEGNLKISAHLKGIDTAIGTAVGTDEKVKVSANDTTQKYLEDAIVAANGTNATNALEISTLNDGADEDLQIRFDQSKVDHGSLAGLADDDHTQYHNDARGDARYYTQSQLGSNSNGEGASLIGIEDSAAQFTATDVEGALAESLDAAQAAQADIDAHLADTVDAHDASAISNVPAGNIAATDVQSALNELDSEKQAISEKGQANGYASLDGSGKVPVSQLPNAIMEYQGTWDASTNTPTLANGAGNADSDIGNVYRVSVAGTVDFGAGNITFAVGDYAILNSSKIWEKADTTDAVSSVNGFTGTVVLDTDDINEGASNFYYTEGRFDTSFAGKDTDDLSEGATNFYYTEGRFNTSFSGKSTSDLAEGSNLYFTDERAQDAVGGILTDTATVDFTYNDAGNQITADVKDNSIDENKLTASVAGAGLSGGNGSALAVSYAPAMKISAVAGEAFAADTTFAVRFALTGETAGRIYKADFDASSSDLFYVVGVIQPTSALSAGDPIDVLVQGELSLAANDTAFAAGEVGQAVHLQASGAFDAVSQITYNANEASVRIAMVKTTSSILVQPMQLYAIN